jgi:hypothetical protein
MNTAFAKYCSRRTSLGTRGIHDVVVQPVWRDERDWEQDRST